MPVEHLWQCPVCEQYFETEDAARDHCPLFSLYECGSKECEHLTETEAINCADKGK